MTRIDQQRRQEDHGGYVVRPPRAIDAVGLTLAAAFANERTLPSDMQQKLDALDRLGRT